MRPKHRRLILIIIALISISVGSYIVLSTFQKNIVFFLTPSEALSKQNRDKSFRIGGVVRAQSLSKIGVTYSFKLIDKESSISVQYEGLLPDLFKEESTVVVQGKFKGTSNTFLAKEVLAKHDENYQPLEIKNKL
tara:strand:+ start:6892 stop:7296 length:405 start_codon:yes stop_codon:yes gene_type:complete